MTDTPMGLAMQHNWRCVFGFHRWNKWSAVKEIVMGTMGGFRYITDAQERTCEACGRIGRRRVV